MGLARGFIYVCLIGGIILVSLWTYRFSGPSISSQNTATPIPPTPASNAARLVKPTLIAPGKPTQLDQGALIYWGICMACHGDRGQGLTDEWRAVFGEDSNCWASKCHAANHPPQGFSIPRITGIPAVVGPAALARFTTTQQLYEYILVSMPWWKPNSLTPEKAWAVTAYILSVNGTLPDGIVLDATDASAIPVHHLVTASQNDRTVELVLAAILVLIVLVMVYQVTVKRRAALTSSSGVTSDSVPIPRRSNFFHHLHPLIIPARQARWRYTLGAGGLAVFLTLVLLVTGILEMFYYVPQADQATISIQTIAHLVPFGGLIRNLHFWGAQALVGVLCIHLLRIVMTGAYKKPRRFNYLLGLSMLVLVIALDFTGYILRWDEGTSWALVVGTNLIKTIPLIGNQLYEFVIGGVQPGSSTVLRFYSWHTFGLTLAMIIAIIWHIFRIRRDGGIAAPPSSFRQGEENISRFELARREMLIMTVAGIALLLLSIFWPAPITPPLTNTTVDLSSARAPWFFLWVQQLLKLGDPFLLGVIVPLVVLVILILIPYILSKSSDAELGRWFPKGGRVAQILFVVLTLLLLALTIWAILPMA
ncbi:MAG: cytochrome b N-terminal domain-containing protein [Chloroflexota bacterium]